MNVIRGLTQAQQEDLKAYLGLDKTFDAFPTKRDAYKPVKNEAASLKINIKNINDAIVDKLIAPAYDTETKNNLKSSAAVYWGNVNSIVHGFAIKFGFTDLAKITNKIYLPFFTI